MKKTIEGYLYNRVEKLGNEKFVHVGFEDKEKTFGDLIGSFVPEIGMKRKVKLTVETLDDK
jgi:hypothetical protein